MNIRENNPGTIGFNAKPIPKSIVNRTKSQLLDKTVKEIDIYCHTSTDEDTLNSAKVFYNWLISYGKKVNLCILKSDTKNLYFNESKYKLKTTDKPADKTVILDFNSKERLNRLGKSLIPDVKAQDIIVFDHHAPEEGTFKNNLYIDESAKSCCSILVRFFETMGKKLSKQDSKNLFCGMVSDFKKSGLIKIKNSNNIYTIHKTDKLLNDKNSLEVFEKIENSLTNKEKNSIYMHLDALSNLSEDEKLVQKELYKNVKVTPNGKIAYVAIPPQDKLWEKVGMDNVTTSSILKDFREKIIEHNFDEKTLTEEQKQKLKNIETAMVFYRKSKFEEDGYCISMHSASNSALKLIKNAQKQLPNITAGGHDDRAGGKITSFDEKQVKKFISAFTTV